MQRAALHTILKKVKTGLGVGGKKVVAQPPSFSCFLLFPVLLPRVRKPSVSPFCPSLLRGLVFGTPPAPVMAWGIPPFPFPHPVEGGPVSDPQLQLFPSGIVTWKPTRGCPPRVTQIVHVTPRHFVLGCKRVSGLEWVLYVCRIGACMPHMQACVCVHSNPNPSFRMASFSFTGRHGYGQLVSLLREYSVV